MVLTRDYLLWSPLASNVASTERLKLQQPKVQRHTIPFLTDLGLQSHQTWMTGSLDLSPKKSKNIHKFQIILKFVLINMKLEKIIHYKHTELFFFAN